MMPGGPSGSTERDFLSQSGAPTITITTMLRTVSSTPNDRPQLVLPDVPTEYIFCLLGPRDWGTLAQADKWYPKLMRPSMLPPPGPDAFPIDSASPHFHHTVWSECGRSVARMWPNSWHVVVTPPHLHHKPTRKVAGFVVKL